jgi:AcrR family transcriptional regulator
VTAAVVTTTKRSKSEEKRQQMITAASNLFLQNGFDGTSMDQVAELGGVSKQTVYSHFGNKENLFTAVIEDKCRSHALTEELFNIERPIRTVLAELALHFTTLIMSDEAICVQRICMTDAAQRSKVSTLFWNAGPKRFTQNFTDYLIAQEKMGNANFKALNSSPQFAAQQLLYMLKADAYAMKVFGQESNHNLDDLSDYISSCIDMFSKAYLV